MATDEREFPVGLVFVGMLLATIGACVSGLGMNMMKASYRLEAHKPLCRRYRWLVGISLACWVNTSLDVIAFALAPLALIAPIGGVTIVVSVVLARFGWAGKREEVAPAQWVAIAAVVSGVAVVDVYGPHPDPQFNTSQVLQHFHEQSFVGYQVCTLSAVCFLYVGMWLGLLGGSNIETTIAAAVAGGLCSGITQTMIKVMATCGGAWVLRGELPFWLPEFWIAAAELICVAFILLHCLNICIGSANLVVATPFYQVMVILFTIVAGCAFYGDLDVATRSELLMFMLGVICVLAGLCVLIFKRERQAQLLPTKDTKEPKPVPTAACCADVAPESQAPSPSNAEATDVLVDDPDL